MLLCPLRTRHRETKEGRLSGRSQHCARVLGQTGAFEQGGQVKVKCSPLPLQCELGRIRT